MSNALPVSDVADLNRATDKGDSSSRAWLWRILVVAVGLSLLAGTYYWLINGSEGLSQGEGGMRVATIEHRTLGDVVTAAGTLKPRKLVEVGAQVTGQLQKLHVTVGDEVAAGDVLAEIDATIQINLVQATRSTLDALEAHLAVQQSALQVAEAEQSRQERLMAADATTAVELERARDAQVRAQGTLVQLQSQIASQRARLTSEEAKLGYSQIYAPIDGTVLEVLAAEGQTLTATYVTPVILHLADLSTLTVEAKVAEANVAKLKPGMGVYFTTLGGRGRRWRGNLDQILPRANVENNLVTYTALFSVDNADGALRADMTAQVFFELTSPREVLTVPLEMVDDFGDFKADGGTTGQVRYQHADGRIELREVRLGETSHTYAEVIAGLVAGDRVVAPTVP